MIRYPPMYGCEKTLIHALTAFATVTTCALALAAQETSARPPHFGGQRAVGLGPAVGFYSGVGGVASVGAESVGLVVAGGYMPVMIFGNEGVTRAMTFDYYDSAQLNLDLWVGPIFSGRKVDIDLLCGYRYNTVLGNGAGLGLRFGLDVSEMLRLEFHWTPHIFPSALERLHDRGYSSDRDAALPWFQGGVGAAAVFYP